jgi:uncharacterized protein (DUF2164 family)
MKKKEKGETVPISSDVLKEEFGHELGHFNAEKTIELLEETKKKKK